MQFHIRPPTSDLRVIHGQRRQAHQERQDLQQEFRQASAAEAQEQRQDAAEEVARRPPSAGACSGRRDHDLNRSEDPMRLSRRSFVKAASVTGIGAFTAPLIAARGSEALRDGIFLPSLASGSGVLFEQEESAPYRVASPGAVRLDSNENPN